MNGSTINETLELLKTAQGIPEAPDALQKAGITQGTGLVYYDLQAPALSLIPVITPLRNMIPRVRANGGTATHWKAITAINSTGVFAGVSEGNRGGVISTTVIDKLATYAGLGLEDYVTFEADYAALNFQDVKATAALNLLRSVMIGEEAMILGGNASLALGTTPTPTVTTATTGGTIPSSYVASIICVALTPSALASASVGAAGVPVGPLTRTNADGSTDTLGTGAAQKSAAGTVTTGGGTETSTITATVTAVPGAAGYAWYFRTAGIERIAAITTTNWVVLIAPAPTATNQLASALPSSDQSLNGLGFDGLITQALAVGSGAYVNTFATGTPGTGTQLTTDGAGGIVEISTALRSFWDNHKMSPDTIWVSAQQLIDITAIIVKNGGAPLVRFNMDANSMHSGITGGVLVDSLLNPITQTMLKLRVHPNMPIGTMLFTASTIPYPMSGVGNLMQMKVRREYYQIEWPLRTRKYEYGVYVDETLQVYAPFALGVIQNIAAGHA
jgi:hypothetical protein